MVPGAAKIKYWYLGVGMGIDGEWVVVENRLVPFYSTFHILTGPLLSKWPRWSGLSCVIFDMFQTQILGTVFRVDSQES